MGVRGLLTYLKRHPDARGPHRINLRDLADRIKLKESRNTGGGEPKLLCDFHNVLFWLLGEFHKAKVKCGHYTRYSYIYGGDITEYSERFLAFVEALKYVGIESEFYVDGKKGTEIRRFRAKLESHKMKGNDKMTKAIHCTRIAKYDRKEEVASYSEWFPHPLVVLHIMMALKSKGVVFVHCIGEADSCLAEHSRKRPEVCGILTDDTDLVVMRDCEVFLCNLFDRKQTLGIKSIEFNVEPSDVVCEMATSQKLAQELKIDEDDLKNLSIICGNNYTKDINRKWELHNKMGLNPQNRKKKKKKADHKYINHKKIEKDRKKMGRKWYLADFKYSSHNKMNLNRKKKTDLNRKKIYFNHMEMDLYLKKKTDLNCEQMDLNQMEMDLYRKKKRYTNHKKRDQYHKEVECYYNEMDLYRKKRYPIIENAAKWLKKTSKSRPQLHETTPFKEINESSDGQYLRAIQHTYEAYEGMLAAVSDDHESPFYKTIRKGVTEGKMTRELLSIAANAIYWRSCVVETVDESKPELDGPLCIDDLLLPIRLVLYKLLGLQRATEYGRTRGCRHKLIQVEVIPSMDLLKLNNLERRTQLDKVYLLTTFLTKAYCLEGVKLDEFFGEPMREAEVDCALVATLLKPVVVSASLLFSYDLSELSSSFNPELTTDVFLITSIMCFLGKAPRKVLTRPTPEATDIATGFACIIEHSYHLASLLGLFEVMPLPAELYQSAVLIPFFNNHMAMSKNPSLGHSDRQKNKTLKHQLRANPEMAETYHAFDYIKNLCSFLKLKELLEEIYLSSKSCLESISPSTVFHLAIAFLEVTADVDEADKRHELFVVHEPKKLHKGKSVLITSINFMHVLDYIPPRLFILGNQGEIFCSLWQLNPLYLRLMHMYE